VRTPSPGLNFYNTGVTLITDKPAAGVTTHFIALANTVFGFVGNKIFALPRGREIVMLRPIQKPAEKQFA